MPNGPSKEIPELGEDESYSLEVSPSGAKIMRRPRLAPCTGLQTLLQLVETSPTGFVVPAVTIHDKPRFPWRGLLIDVSRHFMPLEVLRRNLDGMEAVKLNTLHLHLSDYQGFRVESKKFPKLQEMGSDGLYYTQAEIKDLIGYAADRGIRIVPEFDMPGHATSWFVGYPELASGPGPYTIERNFGVFDPAMDITRDSTYKFLDKFIGEMSELFPEQYFHIGGDEVNGKEWDANPKIQEFKKNHNLNSNEDLQAYFNTRLQKIVSQHKKTMIGWDEILRPELPKSIMIQSWRGPQSLADAAKQGYSSILSAGYYIDLMQPAGQHYAVDPLSGAAANLTPEEQKKILGGEAAMWSEFVSPENIDSRIWPRTAAIAERLWSPQDVKDVDSMYRRLAAVSRDLSWLGLTQQASYTSMLRRIAASEDISGLKTIADVVEPTKGYTREKYSPVMPTTLTPLNRLVDAARPESETARQFAALVDEFIARKLKPGMEAQIREMLVKWRDNGSNLPPVDASFLLKELGPVSQNLSQLGAAGLQALDYMDHAEKAPEAWKTQQLALIEQAEKPTAGVLLMVAPSVQKLVEVSAGQAPSAPRPPETDE